MLKTQNLAKSGQEVVYEGWLTKSPPTKRIWRARWRRRWFSLKHSGEIPNQFILTYYADRNCRKQKGSINLDDCEQVDLGLKLEERKLKLDHVFDIKTPTRTYYLAADSESEMKSWVNCICKVCGLKSTSDDEELQVADSAVDGDVVYCEEEKEEPNLVPFTNHETPPVSPVSTSPYIPISECITGRSPILSSQDVKTLQQNMKNTFFKDSTHTNQTYGISERHYLNYVNDMQDPRFYDSPRVLTLSNQADRSNKKSKNDSPLQSPTDSESVFTDDDTADVNVVVKQKFVKGKDENHSNNIIAPPRPPKTGQVASANYMNLNIQTTTIISKNSSVHEDEKRPLPSGIITDDMYDFPRSHQITDHEAVRHMLQQRHCYNNAAPAEVEGQIFRYDISPKPSTSTNQVFRYDAEDIVDEPASPLSQSSSTTAYSNLPSPLLTDNQLMPPPVVNRDLKPKRKPSDSLSSSSNQEPSSPKGAPSVDRKLKPPTPLQDAHNRKVKASPVLPPGFDQSKGVPSPTDRRSNDEERAKARAAPSPTHQVLGRSHDSLLSQSNQDEQIYHDLHRKMQYLVLDHVSSGSTSTLPTKSSGDNTVYKEVDFEKTEAFNLTRNNLEKERKEPVTFFKK